MTYKAYYELEKAIDADPTFKTKKAQRKVARFAHLHPTAIGQKVEVIVEHFRRHVATGIDGHAKGMVVTGSRESALRMFFGMRDYIANAGTGHAHLKALVAFSGELTVDGETWTEAAVNGFPESQLTKKFDGDDFQLLIVAEKYQTGFDQPKLCAMYVDRKLAGLQAVQTLSRLNRTAPDKDRTFVFDFQNTAEEIREAFKPYYEATSIEEASDPSQIYALEARLKKFGIIDSGEVDRFAETYFKYVLDSSDRIALEGLVRQAVDRWEAEDDPGKQEEFRQLLKSYARFYSFISQVVHLQDTDLEKLAIYATWLTRLLPDRELPPETDVTEDMIRLKAFRINEQDDDYDASLKAGDGTPLLPINSFGANSYTPEEEISLSAIIQSFNQRHGTQFTKEDFLRFEEVNRDVLSADMIEMLRNNPPDVVYSAFSDAFFKGAIRLFQRDAEMKSIVLTDPQARKQATEHFFSRALRAARA